MATYWISSKSAAKLLRKWMTGCWRHPQPRGEMEFSGLLGPILMTWTLQMTWLSSPIPKKQPKRSSFVHKSKKLTHQFRDRLPQRTLPFFLQDMSEPWVMDITDIRVHTTVPSLSGGDTQDETVKQSLALAMIAERCCWKALLWLPCRNRSPYASHLYSAGFRSWLQAGCLPLHPVGLSKPQAPKPGQSPTASCIYQEGCSTVDSSPLWNIRQWASGHPCKGRCRRRTA